MDAPLARSPTTVPLGRRALVLQFLASPFIRSLGRALVAAGFGVVRVNFCNGDRLFWGRGGIDYRGTFEQWPDFVSRLMVREGITDLLLFGDCRPYHRVAIACAREHEIRVHVFEEGYLRPDWITMEEGGTNGNSSLPRDPDTIRRLAEIHGLNQPPQPVSGGVKRRIAYEFASHTATTLDAFSFPHYVRHRPEHPAIEAYAWVARMATRPISLFRTHRAIAQLEASGRPYFIYPMQLEADYQIRVHSGLGSVERANELILASFAGNAPPQTLLVIKQHPLDNGLRNWRIRINACAQRLGVAERIVFADGGHLPTLLKGAAGVVTVNSTVGLQAIHHGRPTIAIGRAIYAISGLTHQGSLDDFWTSATPPDHDFYVAFRRLMVATTQINGSFYTRRGVRLAVEGAVKRLRETGAEPSWSIVGDGNDCETRVPAILHTLQPGAVEAGRSTPGV